MTTRRLLFAACVLAAGCSSGPARNKETIQPVEPRPDWVGRRSGIFAGAKGSSMIEGIASAQTVEVADDAACKEVEKILRQRLIALLPASQPAESMPALKVEDASIFSRWQDLGRGTVSSLCVINRDGVRRTIEQTFQSLQREYMLVQIELILPSAK